MRSWVPGAQILEDTIVDMVRDAAQQGCDAVAIICINMLALSRRSSGELDIPFMIRSQPD
jgi:hypothetical protein